MASNEESRPRPRIVTSTYPIGGGVIAEKSTEAPVNTQHREVLFSDDVLETHEKFYVRIVIHRQEYRDNRSYTVLRLE